MAIKHVCDICGKTMGTLVLTKEICKDHIEEIKKCLEEKK